MGNGGQPLALPDAPPPPGDVVALRVVSEQDVRTAAVAAVAAVAPVAAVAASSPSLSAAEVTALVGLFQGMLGNPTLGWVLLVPAVLVLVLLFMPPVVAALSKREARG